jgi:hypothetical protein
MATPYFSATAFDAFTVVSMVATSYRGINCRSTISFHVALAEPMLTPTLRLAAIHATQLPAA